MISFISIQIKSKDLFLAQKNNGILKGAAASLLAYFVVSVTTAQSSF
jgi:hypothetical protein